METEIEQIRAIRTNPAVRLKPSPYLRESFTDSDGVETKVVLRNYQSQGILNLLQVPRSILSDDTGLGKTLVALSTIGYVWLMEPEYVPIVVTRKSSLYQWDDEIKKFMKNMSAVVVDGEPFERNNAYKEFFGNWTLGRKQLLVMTYDTYLKDFEQSVVRDRTPPSTKDGKAALRDARAQLKAARDALKERKAKFEPRKAAFKERFDGRNDIVKSYLVERLKPADENAKPPTRPSDWSAEDEAFIVAAVAERSIVQAAQAAVDAARDLVEPPVVAEGIEAYLKELVAAHDSVKIMLVMDEAHVIKNHQGKIHDAMGRTAKMCERVIAMTATPVKNRLMEFFSLFRVVCPFLFPRITHFQRDYCIVKMQSIGRNRQVPIVVGHSKDQIERFVAAIEPYYLSRRKYEVAKELPELITREIVCVLSPEQVDLYEMAELEAEEAEAEADPDEPNAHAMKCMVLIQQASNAPQLIANEEGVPYEGESSKLEAIVELLQGAPDSKFLVFSRFKQMIDLVDRRLKKEQVEFVRITGDEGAKERRANRDTYQDPASGTNVMLITTAGTESLNLQATEYIICIDSPWSWGDYVQLTGRGIRIGSKNLTVMLIHLIAMLPGGRETIDHHVVKTLRAKRKLADAVSGEALKGGLEFAEEDMVKEVVEMVRKARASGKTAGVREAVRTRIQSAGKGSKKRSRAAGLPSPFLSLDGEQGPPKRAEPERKVPSGELGAYIDMSDI
jgi:SNF2 family DNA or RNA helicase